MNTTVETTTEKHNIEELDDLKNFVARLMPLPLLLTRIQE